MPGYPRSLAVGFVVVLGVGLVSCDPALLPTTSPPPAFSPLPPAVPPPSQSSVRLSGVVFDYTSDGARPRANVPLVVRTGYLNVFMEVTSDAMGRYSLSGVPVGAISIAPAGGSGYYAPCPAGSDVVQSDRVFDVHIVSATLLSATGAPAEMPRVGAIWVSGVVFERTPQGRQPIAGATVALEGDSSDSRIGSTTLTDAAGRYLVCPPLPSTGTDTYGSLRVSRQGYRPASGSAFLGWDYTGVDIELSRN
jgi:hypothetical protein